MDPADRAKDRWTAGDLRGAEAAFREALDLRPGDPDVARGLAGVLADQDRFDAALRILDRSPAAAAGGDANPTARLRADIFRRSGRVEKAIELLREVVDKDPTASTAWRELALDLASSGRPTEADQALSEALERMPRDPYLWAARGLIAA